LVTDIYILVREVVIQKMVKWLHTI